MTVSQLPFSLPPINPGEPPPNWVGNGFQIGATFTPVLQYAISDYGWHEDLTTFHEELVSDQHFIDQASRNYAIGQLQKYITQKYPTLLEIGCSSGFMLKRISETFPHANIIGSDVIYAPLVKLTETLPHVAMLRFDIKLCPLPDNSVDAIVMLNVLEHISDDVAALKQIYRILKPGGILILEVPAGPHLYDIYDESLMHFRRYALRGLTKIIKAQKFEILKQSHLGFFLYPGFFFTKKKNQKFLSASKEIKSSLIAKNISQSNNNKLFHKIMQMELFLGKLISYPTGIRCLIACKKPI